MPRTHASQPLGQPIPVHIITGFLGSGKTSFIKSLIRQKPPGERWAILINEFGQVGIDQALFETRDDVVVKGLPGGCLCCQLAFVLQAGLVNLLHRSQPDRLLIEPSGLGHPAGLLDLLRSEAFEASLKVSEVITLLDPRRMEDDRALQHETFRDQLSLADGVLLSMTDVASPQQLQAAREHVANLWPAKRWLRESRRMSMDEFLEPESHGQSEVARPGSHRLIDQPAVVLETFEYRQPEPGKPIRDQGESLGYTSLGWRWHPGDMFDLDRLTCVIDSLPSGVRLKGIWHTSSGWKTLNRSQGCLSLDPTVWRSDSRVELIGETLPEVEELESLWKRCVVSVR
ncbi:G3E family GTPase [Modicisalibacter xianhensis]|uniref:G3E family GTPase n=1 Tax=Modicisalibacter xianhensis TaxID=442341 RepID=A0A4R8FVS4_9GAMM|nr:GTP-binding protein [Halomonas xianhensis]TDX30952.1 G3E family GTPase [Halomonas xianhensis]